MENILYGAMHVHEGKKEKKYYKMEKKSKETYWGKSIKASELKNYQKYVIIK